MMLINSSLTAFEAFQSAKHYGSPLFFFLPSTQQVGLKIRQAADQAPH